MKISYLKMYKNKYHTFSRGSEIHMEISNMAWSVARKGAISNIGLKLGSTMTPPL